MKRIRAMILWDRIKRSLDDGVEAVMRVSLKVSERARIEAAVARLMIDKGSLETKMDRLNKRLGARVYFLWEQKQGGIMKDHEVVETLKGITDLNGELAALQLNIQKASLGKGEE